MGDVARARIPFGNLQASGIEELGGGSPVAMNVVSDGAGVIRQRPGLKSYGPAALDANGISALYETVSGDVYAVAGTVPKRNLYFVTSSAATNISSHPGGDIPGTRRPIVAETEALLVFAGGAAPAKLVLATKTSSPLGGSPPQGSHVVAASDRLTMNEVVAPVRSGFNYSNVASGSSFVGHETWTGTDSTVAGFNSVDGQPDPVIAQAGNSGEIWCFGSTSLQVFTPDGSVFVWGPVIAREIGCAAPYSVVKVDATFAWLDHFRRFVVSDGRNDQVISDPIQKTLQGMSVVSDCFGYRVKIGYLDAVVWTFPTDGRTFCYQQGAGWGEWSGWDGNHWTVFPVTAAAPLKSQGKLLVGTLTGELATLDLDTHSDVGGTTINAYIITGFQDHDTDAPKACNRVTFSLRRGETDAGDEPMILLSWRDSIGPWEPAIPLSLGVAGDFDPVVQLWGLGVYRRRQWKLEFTDAADLALVAATEEYEVLGG